MALAFANMTIRAWEAREKVSSGSHIEKPSSLVMFMKDQLSRNHKTNADAGSFNEFWSSASKHTTELLPSQAGNGILQVLLLDSAGCDFTMLNDWGFGMADDHYWGVN